ncbi:1-propanol dehydrogenase PduQ [Evansella sp. AB-rgal1]|uniref:1-propanol dehydrogenase PduQ n=1 Tax=Evansella sp. AB-rgal1 TaxID=3242696 RepID=UPI00359E5107
MNVFTMKTEIIYGSSSVETKLANIKKERIWLVCDAFLVGSPMLTKLTKLLTEKNTVQLFSNIVPDPPLENVVEGISEVVTFRPSVILAIGGGSAIDTAKAVRYFVEGPHDMKIKSFLAMPTTSGTGTEVTSVSVVTDTDEKIKHPIVDKRLVPDVALLLPELVVSCPKTVTAYSGMDVLTHACEALVAKNANVFSDSFAEKAISYVFDYLPTCYEHGEDLVAREKMHEASCLAGLAFESAGLGICHAISHQIGGHFHYPHGLINSILLPKVVKHNSKEKSVERKYADLAKKLQFSPAHASNTECVEAFVRKVEALSTILQCEQSLQSLKFDQHQYISALPVMIENTKKDFTYAGNPVDLSNEELARIYLSII